MKTKLRISSVAIAIAGLVKNQSHASITLGSAENFAVLGSSTVTSTGNTVLNGNLGVSPGSAITGFGPGIVNGSIFAGDVVSQQARSDASAAYLALVNQTAVQNLSGQNLGGITLLPGVRNFNTTALMTGILILDAQGDSTARFDFQIGSTLTTSSGSSIVLINGAQAENVFWLVGSSATLGSGTLFSGTILADQSITLNSGVNIYGRALALGGGLSMDDNIITVPTDLAAVPEPASIWAMGLCASAFGWQWLFGKRRVKRGENTP